MTWVQENQELISDIRTYIEAFQNVKPSLFKYFLEGSSPILPFSVQSEKGAGILLMFCALQQNIEEEKLVAFLGGLYQEFGLDIFRLNRISFEKLQSFVASRGELLNWILTPKIPGILRSVCDFFYKYGGLIKWVETVGDGEEVISTLAQEIFLMGKTSTLKNKPRNFIWLLTQTGCWDAPQFWTAQTSVPINSGHYRFMYFIGPLKEQHQRQWGGVLERVEFFTRFYNLLYQGETWKLHTAMDFYLKRQGKKEFSCQKIIGGCEKCSLFTPCRRPDS